MDAGKEICDNLVKNVVASKLFGESIFNPTEEKTESDNAKKLVMNAKTKTKSKIDAGHDVQVLDEHQNFERLQEAQTEVLQECENSKLENDSQLIAEGENGEWKLIIEGDRLPEQPPPVSANDLKAKVRETLDSCLTFLMDRLKKEECSENDSKHSSNLRDILYNKVEAQKTEKLPELMEFVNVLIATYDGEPDQYKAKMQVEILHKKQPEDLKNANRAKAEALKKDLQKISECIGKVAKVNEKCKILENKNQKLQSKLQQQMEATTRVQEENATLLEEVEICKANIRSEIKELIQAEKQLNDYRKKKLVQAEKSQKLEAGIEETQKKLEETTEATIMANTPLEKLKAEECSNNLKIDEQQQQINSIKELRAKLTEAEKKNQALQEVENGDLLGKGREHQFNDCQHQHLLQLEIKKRNQDERMKLILAEADFNIFVLEQHIESGQNLLQARKEFIEPLQRNEYGQDDHSDDRGIPPSESSMDSLQRDLKRQEDIIAQREEKKERHEMLRNVGEERIQCLKNKIKKLKND